MYNASFDLNWFGQQGNISGQINLSSSVHDKVHDIAEKRRNFKFTHPHF